MVNIMKTFLTFLQLFIYECLNDAHLKHKKELDSLLTLRFQKFNKSQCVKMLENSLPLLIHYLKFKDVPVPYTFA